jgi:hypothetical protein
VSGRFPLFAVPIALLVAALSLAACGGSSHHGIPAGAVAAVEGRPITEAEVNHWLAVAAYSNASGTFLEKHREVPVPPEYTECIHSLQEVAREQHNPVPATAKLRLACEQQHETLRSRAISFLITTDWTFAEAERLGYSFSSSEVDAEYAKLKAHAFPTPAALAQLQANTRQTHADLRLHAKLSLAQEKIQHHVLSGVAKPTEKEIAAYYAANAGQFQAQEARDLRIILTREESKARTAMQEIRAGKSFAAVAQELSIEPTSREKGGLITGLTRNQGQPTLAEKAFAAPIGQLLGPLKTVLGYFVYEVVRSNPQRQQTLAEAKPKIKQTLFEQHSEPALKAFADQFTKRWKPKTECRSGSIVPQCKNYIAPAG